MLKRAILITTAMAAAAASQAAVNFYDFFRTASFTQTSDAQPVAADPGGYYWDARIQSDTAGELTGGSYTSALGTSFAMTPDASGTTLLYGQSGFNSDAEMLAQFGAGTQTFKTVGGALDGKSGTLAEPAAPQYPDAIPYLVTGYSALQNTAAGADVSVTWNSFGGQASFDYTFFDVFDNTTGVFVLNNFGVSGTYTGDTIAGSTLVAGDSYTYNLFFSARNFQNGTGDFSSAFAYEGYDYVTGGNFTVAPEPMSVVALTLGLGLLIRRRRN